METFVWDQNMVTGLPEVDQQHRSLVELFNELNEAVFERHASSEAAPEPVFQRLLDYAQRHFSDEEALMAHYALDQRHIDAHCQLHRQFDEQVRSMWQMRQHLSQPRETIIGFLTAWLGLHIMGVDQAMARQIEAVRKGSSPAQAFEREQEQSDKGIQTFLRLVGNLYRVLAEQNRDLLQAGQLLEERVRQRTQELQAANAQLQAYSRTDGLLGIPNRAYFDQRLEHDLALAKRLQRPLALLMLDVDHFKRYNDRYGHQAGDECLRAVAQAVSAAILRSSDFLARYGGEELAVILPDTSPAASLLVAERILDAVRALQRTHADSPTAAHLTLSIGGFSAVPEHNASEAEYIRQADAALYRAKHEGRDRAVLSY